MAVPVGALGIGGGITTQNDTYPLPKGYLPPWRDLEPGIPTPQRNLGPDITTTSMNNWQAGHGCEYITFPQLLLRVVM